MKKGFSAFTDEYEQKYEVKLDKDTVAKGGEGKNKRWVQIESIAPTEMYAGKLLEWFIEDILGEAIQFPLLVNIRPFGKKSLTKYGHFNVKPRWTTREGSPVWEVALVAEHLNRSPREIVTTILHEAIHVYNYSRNDKDTAKSGRHNKVFASAAEEAGLLVEKHDKLGHVTTGVSDELWVKILKHAPLDESLVNLFAEYKPEPSKNGNKTRAYQCECGNFKVRVPAKQELEATCKLCGADYELVA